jgi:hypothetical protein
VGFLGPIHIWQVCNLFARNNCWFRIEMAYSCTVVLSPTNMDISAWFLIEWQWLGLVEQPYY